MFSSNIQKINPQESNIISTHPFRRLVMHKILPSVFSFIFSTQNINPIQFHTI